MWLLDLKTPSAVCVNIVLFSSERNLSESSVYTVTCKLSFLLEDPNVFEVVNAYITIYVYV